PAPRPLGRARPGAEPVPSGRALAVPAGGQDAKLQVVGADLGAAVTADDRRVQVVPARVTEDRGRRVDGPLVAPGAQRLDHRAQLAAGLGELVLVPRRGLTVLAAGPHPPRPRGPRPGGGRGPRAAPGPRRAA